MSDNWIKVSQELPPQGTKVLCWCEGDCYVGQRIKGYWFVVPFASSQYVQMDTPTMWREIDFPPGFNGKMKVAVENGPLQELDEMEVDEPETFVEFVRGFIHGSVKRQKKLR